MCEKIAENLDQVLSQNMENEGMIIDLSWNIDANEIVKNGAMIMSCTLTPRLKYGTLLKFLTQSLLEKSLYLRQNETAELSRDWKDAPTAVVDHGANR